MQLRAERSQYHPADKGVVPGDVEAIPADVNDDHYVIVKHKDHSHEE